MTENNQSNNPTTTFTGVVAENYEKYFSPMLFTPTGKDLTERLPAKLDSILELACGTGQVTRFMKAKYPNARIVATDLNPDMIGAAKTAMGGGGGIEWMPMDAQEIKFPDNTFDAAVCQFGVMFFPEKQKGVNEAYRVLKPGGKYIFSTWDRIESQKIAVMTRDTVTSFFKDDPPTFFNIPWAMYEPPVMEELMKNAGFKDISVKNVKLEGFSQTAEDAAKGYVAGNPLYFAICERDASKVPDIQSAVKERIEKEMGRENLRIPLSLWITEGTK
jgi:ubiquinone/menaquinone biosynthesis C-methylase UbiE